MKKVLKSIVNKLPYVGSLHRRVVEQGAFEAGHYYSPVPSRKDVARGIEKNRASPHLPDINLRKNEQLALIEEFDDYYPDQPFAEKKSQNNCRYYFDQQWFCYSDAIMLYCMIRKFDFPKIIEVGSGYSSAVMLDTFEALGRNNHEITFIEPYPQRLRSLVDIEASTNLNLIQTGVQDTDPGLFESLNPGDLLFIDSSHVVKYGSDLHFLFFDILPILKQGVIVHFHDIFYPFIYPAEWLKEGRYWNESYFLRAFLSGNSNWDILLFNHYVNQVFSEEIQNTMPLCQRNFGGSIYLQKTG